MSHATVLVKIPKPSAISMVSVEAALAKAMAPYNEQPDVDSPYLKFEEEDLSDYETGTMTKVRMPNGDLLNTWDERLRKPDAFGTRTVPDGCVEVEIPFKTLYPTIEVFAKDYHGCEKHEGKFGFWRNPDAKWDWYQIGGRWCGHFPLKSSATLRVGEPGVFGNEAKPNRGDIVTFDEIDFTKVETETREEASAWWNEWQVWLKDPKDNGWDGPRSLALSMGLLDVVHGPAEGIPWTKAFPHVDDARKTWTDVPKIVSEEEFFRTYLPCFNPLVTFAVLDADGWHEAGRLGWFGSSTDTPETYLEFRRTFDKFIKDDGALYVCVDYHI